MRRLMVLDLAPLGGSVVEEQAVRVSLRTLAPQGLLEVHGATDPSAVAAAIRSDGAVVEVDGAVLRVSRGPLPRPEDLRELEPPEPLERVLLALGELKPGAVHLALLPRFPRMLIPLLDERGADFELSPRPDGSAILWLRGAVPSP